MEFRIGDRVRISYKYPSLIKYDLRGLNGKIAIITNNLNDEYRINLDYGKHIWLYSDFEDNVYQIEDSIWEI